MYAQTADGSPLEQIPIAIDDSLNFLQPATIEALAYWKSKLDGRLMPSRQDLDPRQMRAFMPNIALVELRKLAVEELRESELLR